MDTFRWWHTGESTAATTARLLGVIDHHTLGKQKLQATRVAQFCGTLLRLILLCFFCLACQAFQLASQHLVHLVPQSVASLTQEPADLGAELVRFVAEGINGLLQRCWIYLRCSPDAHVLRHANLRLEVVRQDQLLPQHVLPCAVALGAQEHAQEPRVGRHEVVLGLLDKGAEMLQDVGRRLRASLLGLAHVHVQHHHEGRVHLSAAQQVHHAAFHGLELPGFQDEAQLIIGRLESLAQLDVHLHKRRQKQKGRKHAAPSQMKTSFAANFAGNKASDFSGSSKLRRDNSQYAFHSAMTHLRHDPTELISGVDVFRALHLGLEEVDEVVVAGIQLLPDRGAQLIHVSASRGIQELREHGRGLLLHGQRRHELRRFCKDFSSRYSHVGRHEAGSEAQRSTRKEPQETCLRHAVERARLRWRWRRAPEIEVPRPCLEFFSSKRVVASQKHCILDVILLDQATARGGVLPSRVQPGSLRKVWSIDSCLRRALRKRRGGNDRVTEAWLIHRERQFSVLGTAALLRLSWLCGRRLAKGSPL
eukprot:scaffold1307_cov200-Pinguiococcus_pyrenoidosus.AAC.44